MDKDRLVHSLAVARKCFKIALEQGLSEEDVKVDMEKTLKFIANVVN